MGMVWIACLASDEQVIELMAQPDTVCDFIYERDEAGEAIDLDKQWHAVHHLLTGSPEATDSPLSFVLGSFDEIGPDNGYGAAWHIPKDAVANFHASLTSLTDEELAAKYDAAAMVRDDVYIAKTLAEEGEEARNFVLEDVGRLRAFAAKGAEGGFSAFAMIS
jgi:hypothetical protein